MNNPNTTNLDRLIEAGVIPEEEKSNILAATDDRAEVIESMTPFELVSVIVIHDKLGGKEFFEKMITHAAFF